MFGQPERSGHRHEGSALLQYHACRQHSWWCLCTSSQAVLSSSFCILHPPTVTKSTFQGNRAVPRPGRPSGTCGHPAAAPLPLSLPLLRKGAARAPKLQLLSLGLLLGG